MVTQVTLGALTYGSIRSGAYFDVLYTIYCNLGQFTLIIHNFFTFCFNSIIHRLYIELCFLIGSFHQEIFPED
jgi:hypothetical protein